MTKEDYMHLPKERLAEMLVERDQQITQPAINVPYVQTDNTCPNTGGLCINPFYDCINCPRRTTWAQYQTTSTAKVEDRQEK